MRCSKKSAVCTYLNSSTWAITKSPGRSSYALLRIAETRNGAEKRPFRINARGMTERNFREILPCHPSSLCDGDGRVQISREREPCEVRNKKRRRSLPRFSREEYQRRDGHPQEDEDGERETRHSPVEEEGRPYEIQEKLERIERERLFPCAFLFSSDDAYIRKLAAPISA